MNKVTIAVGIILIAIGVAGYLGTPAQPTSTAADNAVQEAGDEDSAGAGNTSKRSLTALIPAVIGLPLLLLGLMAFKESYRKTVMHIAVLIGLLGALAAGGRAIPNLIKMASGDAEVNSRATLFVGSMFLVCLVYVILCVRSFVAARKASAATDAG